MTDPSTAEPFEFVADPAAVAVTGDALIVRIPAGVTSKPALLQLFARQLHCPQGFGRNWDALRDDLLDLSWLTQQPCQVVIVHDQLPFRSGDRQRLIYLNILGEIAAAPGSPKVRVLFPSAEQQTIQRQFHEQA